MMKALKSDYWFMIRFKGTYAIEYMWPMIQFLRKLNTKHPNSARGVFYTAKGVRLILSKEEKRLMKVVDIQDKIERHDLMMVRRYQKKYGVRKGTRMWRQKYIVESVKKK